MGTRRERVVLELEDNFTTGMAKAAAATALLKKNLKDLDGTTTSASRATETLGDDTEKASKKTDLATQRTKEYTLAMAIADEKSRRLRESMRDQAKAHLDAADGAAVFRKEIGGSGHEIDRFSGRLSLLRDVALTLGPALAPIGAATVPMIAGLSMQLGAAAGAAGVAVLAFNGIGDALGALNDAQIEPTEKNLEKVAQAMTKIGPAGADFVTFLDSIGPQLSAIQDTARAGLLPGVQEGLESLLLMGPRVQTIVTNISSALGEMASNAGEALAGPRFREFFSYIETTAGPTLMEMGRTLGNVTEGLANMMVAFHPASIEFTGGLERMTARFAEWSRGLEDNQGFQNFLDYLSDTGPQVVALLGSLVNALVGLGQAAAPIGAVVVPALTAVANAFAAIAASPVGAPILAAAAAFVALNRAMQIGSALYAGAARGMTSLTTAAGSAGSSMTGLQKAMVGLAVWQVAIQGIKSLEGAMRDALPTTEQLTSRLLDLRDGTVSDLGEDFSQLGDSIGRLTDSNVLEKAGDGLLKVFTLGQVEGQRLGDARAEIELLDSALVNLVNTGGPEAASQAFADLASAQGLTAEETETLRGLLTGYEDALTRAGNASRLAADSTNTLANAEAAQARATQEAVAALRAKRDATLAAFDAETNYRQALKDATAQAKTNTAGIRGNSDAALANRGALSQLAAAWNNQSAAVRNNNQKFQEARAAFIATAQSMGVSEAAARKLANEIMALPKSREIKIVADTSNAMAALYQVQQYKIADKIVRVHTVRTSSDGVDYVSGGYSPKRSADGSTVPKDSKPYGDRYLYMLAPGEEVISNRHGQADRHRSLLKAINAGRLADGGTVRGLANGGTATAGGNYPTSELRDFARATEASRKGLIAEMKVRARHLERQSEAIKKELDASKQKLDAIRAERDAIKASVDSRLRSDVFAAQSPGDFMSIGRPDNWADLSAEQQKAHLDAEWSINQSLGYGQVASPEDLLKQDIAAAREMEKILKQLKRKGLSDNVIGDLLDQGGIEMLRAYAEGSRADIGELNKLYNRRERVLSSASEAGGAFLRDDVRAQTREVKGLRVDLRENRQAIEQTNKRLERLEKLAEKNPKETGSAVGQELNKVGNKAVKTK
ncbi:hypothetical protein NOK12_16460 [Nocardioides sp. OK12]|uniref:hypothetical protein n=1 Tax=Nocardioides sp. OK12 TaxID=2758661 RepID=UPI0021C42E25|nr:hypothetical protein [Nocardioides sp. OK12]GHJ59128.1 hypothetical protein NOK12_16460 [Nocardioides sp. OK12]